ncbi:MAG: twin-arginine translocase subunit TatC [Deferribacteraceae bacterium]|jgi:sec-independent protein translocase protein TatC|nr:twin-arginine translocase subunit TatC [Deferribacteraceae bacterium]
MATTDKETVETSYPLSHHLEELRKRIGYVICFWIILFFLCFWQNKFIKDFVTRPLRPYIENNTVEVVTLYPLEGFLAVLKMAMLASLFFCIPFMLYQVWRFVSPGLYKRERRYLLGVVISGLFLFLAGAAFVYIFVFPLGFKFFVSFSETLNIKNTWSLTLHMSLILKMLIAFGGVFELPVVIFFLAKIGIVNAEMLRKYRKFAIIGIFIIAAIITPPDVISQLMMAAPLLLLYEISIFIAKIFNPKPAEAGEKDSETNDIYQ